MDKYRKRVAARIKTSAAAAVVGAVVCIAILAFISGDFEAPSGQNIYYIRGFVSGIGGAIVAISISVLAGNILALKNENKLRERFIKETDEREHAIKLNTEGSTAVVIRYGLGLSCLIFVVFDMTVFYTLFTILMVISLISASFRWYYSKRL